MTEKRNGGPAFPRSATGGADTGQIDPGAEGMSLRDWYEGMVIQGLVSSAFKWIKDSDNEDVMTDAAKQIVRDLVPTARFIADAMLKAREANDD